MYTVLFRQNSCNAVFRSKISKKTHVLNRGKIETIFVFQDAVLREPSAQSTEASAAITKAGSFVALIMGIQKVPCECHTTPSEITYV